MISWGLRPLTWLSPGLISCSKRAFLRWPRATTCSSMEPWVTRRMTRKVEVIRLVTHGSIEEQVVALGQRKKALFDQLIKPGESQVAGLSPQEIMSLFR